MLFLCSIQFGSAEAGGGPGSVSVVFPDLLLVFRSGSTQLSYGAASSSTSSLYPSSRRRCIEVKIAISEVLCWAKQQTWSSAFRTPSDYLLSLIVPRLCKFSRGVAKMILNETGYFPDRAQEI